MGHHQHSDARNIKRDVCDIRDGDQAERRTNSGVHVPLKLPISPRISPHTMVQRQRAPLESELDLIRECGSL